MSSSSNIKLHRRATDSEQTKIPFGLNKNAYLISLFVLLTIHGSTVMNFPPMESVMISSNSYHWLCKPTDVFDEKGTCSAQRVRLVSLGSMSQTMMLVGSLVGGFIADQFGPKAVSVFGCSCFFLSYLCLAFSSRSLQLYYLWAVLVGLAIEPAFFGCLSVPNLFPQWRASILSVMGGVRSLANLLPFAYSVMTDHGVPMRTALLIGACLSFGTTVFAIFMIPSKPFMLIYGEHNLQPVEVLPGDPGADGESLLDEEENTLGDDLSSRFSRSNSRRSFEKKRSLELELGIPDYVVQEIDETKDERKERLRNDFRDFIREAVHPFYLVWVVVYGLSFAPVSFYPLSVQDQHPTVGKSFAYISWVAAIPCTFYGIVVDKWGYYVIFAIMVVLRLVLYLCFLAGDALAFQWLGVIFYWNLASFVISQNYSLIQCEYRQNVQGKLSGLASCTGGLLSLFNTLIYSWASNANDFRRADWLFIGLDGIAAALCVAMYFLNRLRADRRPAFARPLKGMNKHEEEPITQIGGVGVAKMESIPVMELIARGATTASQYEVAKEIQFEQRENSYVPDGPD